MGMTAAQLTAEMDLDEFLAHWADYQIGPWGEDRADLRSGILAALLFNVHRGPRQKAKGAADFMPYRAAPADEATARQRFFKHQRRRRS